MITYRKAVLVVCHGNINRSPLAAAVLRRFLPLDWIVWEGALKDDVPLRGERAAAKMRDAAAEHGYDLENHRSRRIQMGEVTTARWIVYMDKRNRRYLDLFEGTQERLLPLGQYAEPRVESIPDPAWLKRDSPEFRNVVNLLIEASKNLAIRLHGEMN